PVIRRNGVIDVPSAITRGKNCICAENGPRVPRLLGIQVPEPRLIGELIAKEIDDCVTLKVGPDRHHGLGGPFSFVREYLQAHIRASLISLEKQQGIEEYKEQFLDCIG